MRTLKQLCERCHGSVEIIMNGNRDYYETIEEWMNGKANDIRPEVAAKMIETNSCVALRFYPITPIGFRIIYHWDIDLAIEEAHKSLDEDK